MTELIELHPRKTVKPRRSQKHSKTVKIVQTSSDSSSDDSNSNDESPLVLQLSSKSSKSSKRTKTIPTLPIIINAQPATKKKKRHQKPIQQFLINAQPPPPPASPDKKEIIIQQIVEPSIPSSVQYVPISATTPPMASLVETDPFAYQHFYTPNVIRERPFDFYHSYEIPDRRFMRVHPSSTRSVHLPRHARKLVNRFLNGMEHAHGYRYGDEHDSDCSIDDCRVCRRLRSAMNGGRRRSNSELDLYHGSRVIFDTHDAHTHKHGHSNNCKVCNLLQKSDIVISQTSDHVKPSKKKRGKHVHVVESYQSNIKPVVETITTTTTAAAAQPPKTLSSIPTQAPYYPTSYTTYVDPNTGLAYAYDPNWQYDLAGASTAYDYSSYYNNPTYIQSHPQYEAHNTTVPATVEASNLTTQQQHSQTTSVVSPNPIRDKGTYTYMPADRKKRKPTNQTVVVHTSRNATPPAPKIYIEQPRPSRLPEKIQSTTIIKERTSRAPRVASTSYYHV